VAKKVDIEKKFTTFINKVCKELWKEADSIGSSLIQTFTYSAISLLQGSNVETIKETKKSLELIDKKYHEFKSKNTAKVRTKDSVKFKQAEIKRLELEVKNLQKAYENTKKRKGLAPEYLKALRDNFITHKEELQTLHKSLKVNIEDYETADSILTKCKQVINSQKGINVAGKELVIKDLTDINRSQKLKGFGKKVGLGTASALTGSILPSMIPEGVKDVKKWIKDLNDNSGKGKAKMLGGLALKGLGALTGSALPLMMASKLNDSANTDLQKKQDAKASIDALSKSIFRAEFNAERGASISRSRTRSGLSKEARKEILRLSNGHPKIKKLLDGRKHGGTFETTGITKIGSGMVAGEAGPETIKIIPKGKDPIVESLQKTNSLIQQLLTTNEQLVDAENDKARLAGLANKDPKKGLMDSSILSNKKSTDTVATKASGSIVGDLLEAEALKKIGGMLIPMLPAIGALAIPVIGGLLAAGVFTAGIFGIKKLLDDSGMNAKWEKEGRDRQAAKAAEEARTGETPAKRNADRLQTFGVSQETADANQASFYAKGGSFETNGPHKMVVGEAGRENVTVTPINKPLAVVIKDDQSKLGKEQLSSIRKNDLFKKEQIALENKKRANGSTPNEATPSKPSSMLSSIGTMLGGAGQAISSGAGAAGEAISGGWEATKTAVGGAAQAVGKGFSAVKDSIFGASKASGVDAGTMTKFAQVESGFKSNAKAGTSSATGLYQFTKATWQDMLQKHGKQYGLDKNADPNDPKANSLMAAEFIKDNQKALKSSGIPATDGALYLMHFLGPGATKLLKANRNGSAAKLFPEAAKSNASIFYNKDGSEKTVGDIIGWADKKMNIDVSKIYGDAVPPSAQAVQSTPMAVPNSPETKSAKVTPKNKKEGSVKNIKGNASNGSEGSALKNKEVATDVSNDINNAKGTQQAINNINIGGNSAPAPTPNVNITTGDNKTFGSRLARSY
jgi:hypothetical protein